MSFSSYYATMPDLTGLEIPEKMRKVTVRDDVIFRDLLNEKRTLADRIGGAEKGDYVLAEATGKSGWKRTLHIELGQKRYPGLEEALLGCKPGDNTNAEYYGEPVQLQVVSVRMPVEYSITDEGIAALSLTGITTLVDYRRKYIDDHGTEIADRLFKTMYDKLQKQLMTMGELVLSDADLRHYHEQQREMIQNISGDVNQRLIDAYSNGTKSAEECDSLFFEDNRVVFASYVWGRCLAEADGYQPSEEEIQASVSNYCMIFDKTEEQLQAEGLMEDAMRSFYFSYGSRKLEEYYCSILRFHAEGIPSQPCKY